MGIWPLDAPQRPQPAPYTGVGVGQTVLRLPWARVFGVWTPGCSSYCVSPAVKPSASPSSCKHDLSSSRTNTNPWWAPPAATSIPPTKGSSLPNGRPCTLRLARQELHQSPQRGLGGHRLHLSVSERVTRAPSSVA